MRPELRDPVWRADTLAVADQVGVNGVWMTGGGEAYAVGGVGDEQGFRAVVWRHDGTRWSEAYSKFGANFEDVHGTSSNNIWVVGGLIGPNHRIRGVVAARWDGTEWTDALVDSFASNLLCVWTEHDGDAYAGGEEGVLIHWDGAGWHREPNPFVGLYWAEITDIWGVSGTCSQKSAEIYSTVFRDTGKLLRRNGGEWALEFESPLRSIGFAGLWGNLSHGLYILDRSDGEIAPYGTVFRLVDTTWSLTNLKFEDGTFTAIRGDEWGTVYVVKWGGVYRLVGDSVVAYNALPLSRAVDVWVSGLTVMACGTNDNAGVVAMGSF